MNFARKILLAVGMILLVFVANAQIDTLIKGKIKENKENKEKEEMANFHSPKKATLLALIPGAGQAYNRKYWKMPIVYATMGTCMYFAISNHKEFSRFKKAYIQRDNGEHDEFYGILSQEAILNNMDNNRTIRDYLIAGTVLLYALQIIDANVDAHLFYFDVGDNLSAVFYPQTFNHTYTRTPILGVGCTLNF